MILEFLLRVRESTMIYFFILFFFFFRRNNKEDFFKGNTNKECFLDVLKIPFDNSTVFVSSLGGLDLE